MSTKKRVKKIKRAVVRLKKKVAALEVEARERREDKLERCRYCGGSISSGANFCAHCGSKIRPVCDCWVLHKLFDCGETTCPGRWLNRKLRRSAERAAGR